MLHVITNDRANESASISRMSAPPPIKDSRVRSQHLSASKNRFATAQSIYGNQAVLRMLSSAPGPALHRKCACDGSGDCSACAEKKAEGLLQRRTGNRAETNGIPPIVGEVLQSPGSPLEAGTRSFMESRFGHDFSDVRIHTGARASESARAVNALAYTVGNQVVFAGGQYAPQSPEGLRLLAHELTHTIQQGGNDRDVSRATPHLQRQEPLPGVDDFPPLTRPAEQPQCTEMISANDIEAKGQQPNTLSIIELGADWCGPCKLLRPILNELCNDYKTAQNPAYRFYEVNIEESPQIKQMLNEKYGVGIPHTLALFGGKQIAVLEGIHPKTEVQTFLNGVAEAIKPSKHEEKKLEKAPVQPKLAVSSPGDAYEVEADRVAESIMRMRDPVAFPRDSFIRSGMNHEGEISRKPKDTPAPSMNSPLTVDRIDIINSKEGAIKGFEDIEGDANLNRPGRFETNKELKNVHQIHFHLDQGSSSQVLPHRCFVMVQGTEGGQPIVLPDKGPVGPLAMCAGNTGDGPEENEVKRPSTDTIVVADAPGPRHYGIEYPYYFDVDFTAGLEVNIQASNYMPPAAVSLDLTIAFVRYKVEIRKENAGDPGTNKVTKLSAVDLVRNQQL
jgi:thiol-disulfide isomerase/thioredoxin